VEVFISFHSIEFAEIGLMHQSSTAFWTWRSELAQTEGTFKWDFGQVSQEVIALSAIMEGSWGPRRQRPR
jgi:hypothetical protein